MNIGWTGNTTAASVLLALADLLNTLTPADGTRILLGAFGAGLTWCAAVLEWGVPSETGEIELLSGSSRSRDNVLAGQSFKNRW